MRKTLCIITQWGLYENLVQPQSISLAIDIFQQSVQPLFTDIPATPIFYIGNLLCHSNGMFEEHLKIIDTIITYLETAGM